MIMISFRTKRDKDDMIYKAKEMEKFAREFVECLERGEENYDVYEKYYRDNEHDDMDYRDGMKMHGSRYGYNR